MWRNAKILLFAGTILLSLAHTTYAFVSRPASKGSRISNIQCFEQKKEEGGGFFRGVSSFFKELDAFMDDATARRLGNGAAFYGKRKSNFYGEQDKNRKRDRSMSDPMEDYQGPTNAGYFQWMPDEDGQMRPVTRMKEQIIERNPKYWDRVYDEAGNEKEESK
ncbi:predicted protein [Phaeodactylum tricornutum CCAP 1055/1]|jgi:hypothetical protein|uniref:Uncharacterized protein n=2 Tax=Phaeodactylum tricornutum TaxID=2850 RepID=B7FTD0_PHATC|nr:predicted protein [Phaeodactylum tricornutum CCAP 1055/1]EEC50947.1 predicted protein [Phaeodactylum tricornutum CCAP 1055/1]|eukprot:XP_002178133.1 predicted protein [Phaeodactylum tricornutum CCAP 1055/1]